MVVCGYPELYIHLRTFKKQEYILQPDWSCLAEAPPMTRIRVCCVVNFTREIARFIRIIRVWCERTLSHRGSLLKVVAVQGVLCQIILNAKLTGRKELGRKCAQATGMTASLRIQSSKADSNTRESFTRSELKLESVHQESPRSDVFRKRATKPLLKQKQRQHHLTWANEKKIWTVAQ